MCIADQHDTWGDGRRMHLGGVKGVITLPRIQCHLAQPADPNVDNL